MKIKSHLGGLLIALFALSFAACDDDVNAVGGTIQPGGDNIGIELDTFYVKTKAVLVDSMYARTNKGLLGSYEDELFGTVKSDYLCEFYVPQDAGFKEESDKIAKVTMDSVQVEINFVDFSGDTLAPMGLSIYKITKPLTRNFYTNIKASDYCDMSKMLGQKTYTISQTPIYTNGTSSLRTLSVDLDKGIGEDIYKEWRDNRETFTNSGEFKKFFPGIYVTTHLGSTSLIASEATSLSVYYHYTKVKGNYNETADTIINERFYIAVTEGEVIQLNRVENSIPSNLLNPTPNSGSLYLKSPAGIFAEVELPIMELINKYNLRSDTLKTINSAKFSMIGNSEAENGGLSKITNRPQYLLLIDKDSVKNFFLENKFNNIDSKTRILLKRDDATNSYNFRVGNSISNNISILVSNYVKRKDLTTNPTFLLIPVDVSEKSTSSIDKVYNTMTPSTAIIRNDNENMKMSFILSKY